MARRPTLEELTTRLIALKGSAIGVDQDFFRSAPPKYSSPRNLINGKGAKVTGGRWNKKGVAAIYLSDTPELAMQETLAFARYMGWPASRGLPRVFAALRIKLSSVLDLTDGSIRRQIKVSKKRIVTTDWRKEMKQRRTPLTHILGQAAFDAGFEALIVPSATGHRGANIAIFPANRLPSSSLKVLNPDDF